jgi:hypothetical protein
MVAGGHGCERDDGHAESGQGIELQRGETAQRRFLQESPDTY